MVSRSGSGRGLPGAASPSARRSFRASVGTRCQPRSACGRLTRLVEQRPGRPQAMAEHFYDVWITWLGGSGDNFRRCNEIRQPNGAGIGARQSRAAHQRVPGRRASTACAAKTTKLISPRNAATISMTPPIFVGGSLRAELFQALFVPPENRFVGTAR